MRKKQIEHTENMMKDAGIGNNYKVFKSEAEKRGWIVCEQKEIFTRDINYARVGCIVEKGVIKDLKIG